MPADSAASLSSSSSRAGGPGKAAGIAGLASACEACRKAKTRCNKAKPVCSNCNEVGRRCEYGADRRSLRGSASSLIALQARVAVLEAQLELATSRPPGGSPQQSPPRTTTAQPPALRWLPGGSLSLSPSGALRYLDPTSSFFRTNPVDARVPAPAAAAAAAAPAPAARSTADGVVVDYLPVALDLRLHELVLDLALERMLSYCGFVRADALLRDLAANPLRRTANFSPFLHLACLAHGTRYLPTYLQHLVCAPGETTASRGGSFAAAARALVDQEAIAPDLSFLRGLQILSAFFVGMGQDRLAVMYAGLADVIAEDFRLHLAFDPNPNDPDLPDDWRTIIADRQQLSATMSCIDLQWSSYLGRASSIPRSRVTQPLPPLPQSDGAPTPLVDLTLAYHARLAVLASAAIAQVYYEPFADVDGHIQSALGHLHALDLWYETLPQPLQLESEDAILATSPHVTTLIMFYYALRILLCRPFIGTVQAHPSMDCIHGTCRDAAWAIVRIIRIRRNALDSTYGPLTNQELAFIAGTIFVLLASGHFPAGVGARPQAASEALADLCGFLREFGERAWPNALQSAQALERVWQEFSMA